MYQGTILNQSRIPIRREQVQPGPVVLADGIVQADNTERIVVLENAPAGGSLSGAATITLPTNAGRGVLEWTQTVAATGVTVASIVICQLAQGVDADENTADMVDLVALSASPAADAITFNATFAIPHSGPMAINWSA